MTHSVDVWQRELKAPTPVVLADQTEKEEADGGWEGSSPSSVIVSHAHGFRIPLTDCYTWDMVFTDLYELCCHER